MSDLTDEFPNLTPSVLHPWQAVDRRQPSRARILREMARYRGPLAEHFPSIVVPARPAPTRLGALLLVWNWWEDARSSCPTCGAMALMVSFGGMLSIGHMSGICIGCAQVVTRRTGGFLVGHGAVRRAPDGSGYSWPIQWGASWSMGGSATAIVAALQELGAAGLPRSGRARL
jgi:hypothetical protein